MHYVKHFDINGVDTKQVACIELHGKPNAATEGHIGVLGIDVDSPLHDVYKCVAVNGSIYTWELLSSGMSMISATITFGGAETVQFPYINLRTPAMYVVKIGDLIVDKDGYLYQIDSLNSTYCEATYCDTQAFQGAPGEKGDKGDPGEVDYSRLNDYAKLASPNNMLHNGNEFTFIPDGYTGQIYINHRTASGQANGNVSNYYFGNGNGGLATFIAGYFKGKFQGETARPIYNNAEVAMLSDVPSKTETWTFTLEDGSTVTKVVCIE